MRDILVLAKDDFGDVIEILLIVGFVLLALIGTLLGKAKERAQRRRAEEIEQQRALRGRQGGAPAQLAAQSQAARQSGPPGRQQIEEDVQAVIGRLFGIAPQAQAPVRPPTPRPPPQPPRRPAQRRAPKPPPPAERQRAPGRLAAALEQPVAGPELKIALAGRDEARRGIVYAEILGLPKALRANLEPWER